MIVIYDVEVFPNLFSLSYSPKHSDEIHFLCVSTIHENPIVQMKEFVEHLSKITKMVGYNNVSFDAPLTKYAERLMIEMIRQYDNKINYDKYELELNVSKMLTFIYLEAQRLIGERWIKYDKSWKPQCDVYRISHFDNPAKSTSLKYLSINLKWSNVIEMPFEHNHYVRTMDEIEQIKEYNFNDVLVTKHFYELSKDKIKMRDVLGRKYDLSLMNYSDSKMGEEIILSYLAKEMNTTVTSLRYKKSTYITIPGKDIVFDYVSFTNPILNSIKEKIINTQFNGEEPSFEEEKLLKGIKFKLGIGGIHGATKQGIYESDKEHIILSIDVQSYYPNLAIKNEFYPAQFGKSFCTVLDQLFQDRISYPKGSDENTGLKLSINSLYGKTGDKYSPLRDIQYMLKTTINGQLLLLMLFEKLMSLGQVLLINTDGLEIRIKRSDYLTVLNICKEWETLTKLKLEYDEYDKMIIANVNNYSCINTKGKIKRKGLFEIDKDLHKDNSMRIVPIALEQYFYHGIPIKETVQLNKIVSISGVEETTSIFDFCLKIKAKGETKYEYHVLENNKLAIKPTQKNIRYYISNHTGTLIKRYETNKSEFVNIGVNQTLFNKYIDGPYNLNYNFYHKECNKIIENIEPSQLTLF